MCTVRVEFYYSSALNSKLWDYHGEFCYIVCTVRVEGSAPRPALPSVNSQGRCPGRLCLVLTARVGAQATS